MPAPPDVFNPRRFWTALMSSYMTPYFLLTGDGIPLHRIPVESFTRKQKKMICGCTECLGRKGLGVVDWEDPDTGETHQIVVPMRLLNRL